MLARDLSQVAASHSCRRPAHASKRPLVRASSEFPDDPALPALGAIRAVGLARAIPSLGLAAGPIELILRAYKPGARATFEARAEGRRFAVKAYASDAIPEAALYGAFRAAGLAGPSGARVPPLLAFERDLKVMVIGWLEGPTASELVKRGEGRRAGELAASWVRRTASLPVTLGPPRGAADILARTRKWAANLGAADPVLGAAASVVAGMLALTEPKPRSRPVQSGLSALVDAVRDRGRGWLAGLRASDPAMRFAAAALPPAPARTRAKESAPGLVHGTLYARHVIDSGDGPGVIDWQQFGQGPVEFDAGTFLATIWRIGQKDERLAPEARRTEEAFLAGTAGLLNAWAVAWYRAAMLLRLADKYGRRGGDALVDAHALLSEAVRQTGAAG
jgi:hypothetical protein